jgi:Family of unknown function (DUF5681)
MPFLPGQSGNPGGGGTRKPFVDAVNMELAMNAQGRLDPVPKLSARGLIRVQIAKAAEGDLAALTFLAERVEGKAKAIVTGESSEPIQLMITRGDEARDRIVEQLNQIAARGGELALQAVSEESEQ